MKSVSQILLLSLLTVSTVSTSQGEVTFDRARELMELYCYECHDPANKKGDLDLASIQTEADFLTNPHLLEDL